MKDLRPPFVPNAAAQHFRWLPGNSEIDHMSPQRSLEIAILQVVNDLMVVGRRLAFPLRTMRREMLRAGVDDKAVTKAIQGARLLDCLGAAGVVSKTISGIPLVGGPGACGAVELFIDVPEAVILIEFEELPETIKRRIGFARLRSVLGRVIGAMRGLCIDGRLTKVDHTGSMECAYMRPDGHHVYLNEWRESLCVSLHHPKSLVEFESAGAAAPPGHKGPEPYVRLTAYQGPIPLDATYPAYEITVAGRTIIEGLPSILDPTAHWPPPRPAIDLDEKEAWKRLKLTESNATSGGGDDVAELDGETYRLPRKQHVVFLRNLQDAQGQTVTGQVLETDAGARPDRLWEALPPKLQLIIEKPGRGRTGYRMV